jgi:hypothetical protein
VFEELAHDDEIVRAVLEGVEVGFDVAVDEFDVVGFGGFDDFVAELDVEGDGFDVFAECFFEFDEA